MMCLDSQVHKYTSLLCILYICRYLCVCVVQNHAISSLLTKDSGRVRSRMCLVLQKNGGYHQKFKGNIMGELPTINGNITGTSWDEACKWHAILKYQRNWGPPFCRDIASFFDMRVLVKDIASLSRYLIRHIRKLKSILMYVYLRDSRILRWANLCWQQKHQQMVGLSDTWVPQIRYLIITLSSFSRSKLPFFSKLYCIFRRIHVHHLQHSLAGYWTWFKCSLLSFDKKTSQPMDEGTHEISRPPDPLVKHSGSVLVGHEVSQRFFRVSHEPSIIIYQSINILGFLRGENTVPWKMTGLQLSPGQPAATTGPNPAQSSSVGRDAGLLAELRFFLSGPEAW